MSIFSSIKRWVTPKSPPPVVVKNWRIGMWVMNGDKVAVLTKIDTPCEVHYVNPQTGETISTENISLNALRQARWVEIPESRRGCTEAQALELGYGP